MRICHIVDSFEPTVGGIEIHVKALAISQQQAGDEVNVITLTSSGDDFCEADGTRVRVHRLHQAVGESAGLGVLQVGHIGQQLHAALESIDPDVLHIHASIISPLAAAAISEATSTKRPALVTVHSMWEGFGPLPWLLRLGLRPQKASVLWSAVSHAAAHALAPMVSPRKVLVLPNAVEPTQWRGIHSERLIGAQRVHVVAVMRLTGLKRTLPLAKALRAARKRVPDSIEMRATIAGDGPQRQRLERYLRRHKMTDWVDLPGNLDRAAVRTLLADGDVFVAPAEREAFGIAALEARSAGLPVVAPRGSGVEEFVTHGKEGLLAANNRELGQQIAALCSDEHLRAEITMHNRAVAPTHDWHAARYNAHELYLRAMVVAAEPVNAAPWAEFAASADLVR